MWEKAGPQTLITKNVLSQLLVSILLLNEEKIDSTEVEVSFYSNVNEKSYPVPFYM